MSDFSSPDRKTAPIDVVGPFVPLWRWRWWVVVIFCITFGLVAAYLNYTGDDWIPDHTRTWIRQWADFKKDDPPVIIIDRLRQAVHDASGVSSGSMATQWPDTILHLRARNGVGGSCGNFTVTLVHLLRAAGLQARPVQLGSERYRQGKASNETHMLAEVFDPVAERWFLADPTFNTQYEDESGRVLGLAELLQRTKDEPWSIRQFTPVKPGRSAAEYYMPVKDLFHMASTPTVDLPALDTRAGEGVQWPAGSSFQEVAELYLEPGEGPEPSSPSLLVARPYGAGHIVLEGDGEPAGLYYEWTLDPDAAYQFTLAADTSMGNVRLRVDAGTEESAVWRSVGPNLIQLCVDGVDRLRIWIYAEETFRCDVTDLQLRQIDHGTPRGEWAFGDWIPDYTRTWVRQWAGFNTADPPVVIVDRLRQAVHDASGVSGGSMATRWPDAIVHLRAGNGVGGSCGNFAVTLVHLLRAAGLQARPVQLGSKRYRQGKASNETHMLAEVFDPVAERWFLADPTFNTQYEDESGRVLGLAELLQRTKDEPWSIRQFTPVKPGRSAAEYYMPVKDLFHMASTPTVDLPALDTRAGKGVQWPAGSSFQEVAELYLEPGEGAE